MTRRRTLRYWQRHQQQKCGCAGYWFPHRKGGGACTYSPRSDFYLALRHGASLEEAKELLTAEQLERLFPVAAGAEKT